MSDPGFPSDAAWKAFLDFIYSGEEHLTDAEVDEELKRLGINVRPALERVRRALAAQQPRRVLRTRNIIPLRGAEQRTMNEADTCRKLIRPKLEAAGWDNDP